ncbi:MAG: hypothetical protein R3C05_21490 [Pirellulaceae bacterium]
MTGTTLVLVVQEIPVYVNNDPQQGINPNAILPLNIDRSAGFDIGNYTNF